MSLSYSPLNPVLVRDPITMVDSVRDYAILKGANQVSWKRYTSTNVSNSSITWSAPPPSGNVFVDRKQYVMLPVRLTFSALAGNNPSFNVLNSGCDAPRCFPLSGSLEVLQASINGQSVSIFMSDIIHALTHFNTGIKLQNKDYSLTPTYYDQTQSYDSLIGSVRNPLGTYGDGLDQCPMPRGAFPFNIVQNTSTSAIVDMVICEPLFLSPFYFGGGDDQGFYNVSTMDFNLTFLSNANRFWSHCNLGADYPQITNIVAEFSCFTGHSFSYSDAQPLMLFKYLTPDSLQVLSPNMPITYPFYDVQRYPLPAISMAAGQSMEIPSNNLQLNSIPRMMYVYARTQNSDLYAAGSGCSQTDTYLSLERFNLTFANYTGLLASADRRQLYQISYKNGCTMSWTQWSGDQVYIGNSSNGHIDGTIGSILAIEFATDVGLPSDACPGLQGAFQMQVFPTFKNNSNNSINAQLWIVIVSEGSFTIPGLNSATRQLGVISKKDIIDAQSKPGVTYDQIRESEYGGEGNFLSNLRKFGSKIHEFLKDHKVISRVAHAIPHPISHSVGDIFENLGYGEHERGGIVIDPSQYHDYGDGVSVGGKRMSHSDLKRRLRNV